MQWIRRMYSFSLQMKHSAHHHNCCHMQINVSFNFWNATDFSWDKISSLFLMTTQCEQRKCLSLVLNETDKLEPWSVQQSTADRRDTTQCLLLRIHRTSTASRALGCLSFPKISGLKSKYPLLASCTHKSNSNE